MVVSRSLRFATLAACTILTVAACGDGDVSTPTSSTPEVFTNFTPHVWSAEAGVDLFGRGSELIRAASEAGFYWPAIEEIDDYFPGFTPALAPEQGDFALTRWATRAEYLAPLDETKFLHIADYSETESSVAATVCHYTLHSTPGSDEVDPPSRVYRIVLENVGESKGAPGVVDHDAAHGPEQQAPSWNVFGSWKIRLGQIFFGGTQESPTKDGFFIPQECRDWWAERFPGLAPLEPGSPYQTQPPGFVAPVMPVGVQFPGWIGPSNVA